MEIIWWEKRATKKLRLINSGQNWLKASENWKKRVLRLKNRPNFFRCLTSKSEKCRVLSCKTNSKRSCTWTHWFSIWPNLRIWVAKSADFIWTNRALNWGEWAVFDKVPKFTTCGRKAKQYSNYKIGFSKYRLRKRRLRKWSAKLSHLSERSPKME